MSTSRSIGRTLGLLGLLVAKLLPASPLRDGLTCLAAIYIVVAAGSNARGLWAVGTIAFMLLGVGGLVVAISWLALGEPTRQFGRTTRRQPDGPR